jgi:hypothetical protein
MGSLFVAVQESVELAQNRFHRSLAQLHFVVLIPSREWSLTAR